MVNIEEINDESSRSFGVERSGQNVFLPAYGDVGLEHAIWLS